MYLILDQDPNPVSKPNFQDLFDWKSGDPRIDFLIQAGELSRFKLIKRRRIDMPFKNFEPGALTLLHISEYVEFKYGSQLIAEFRDSNDCTTGSYNNISRNPLLVFIVWEYRCAAINSVVVDPYWPIGAVRKAVLGRETVDNVLESLAIAVVPSQCQTSTLFAVNILESTSMIGGLNSSSSGNACVEKLRDALSLQYFSRRLRLVMAEKVTVDHGFEENFVESETMPDSNVQDLSENGKDDHEPIKPSSKRDPIEPCKGMIFDDLEDAMACYKVYARKKGFSIEKNILDDLT
ncbi:hypothetical protein RHSIM_Rhsim02G0109200 [Rhododendron simsii]|uniref:Uncharacterized protein n=1 Tax=Rhododendron simsii TaxID=118357 RepID=A0A834HF36_RHOSS|nr:hypothetical protein RHSIM_Rhsim02G0109200 [Rhododendron simsii]